MKRKLLKQMLTEWQSNIWLVVELIIVGSAMAGIMALLFYILNMRYQPSGYEVNDTYVVSLDRIGSDSPEYVKYDDKDQADDVIYKLMSQLRALPEVELLGYGVNAMPFSKNFYGMSITSILEEDTVKIHRLNYRAMSPEMPIIMNLKGVNGETSEQISKMIERGEIIITNKVRDKKINPVDCIGRDFDFKFMDTVQCRLGAVIPGMKRVDFEAPGSAILMPYEKVGFKRRYLQEFYVKIKHGTDKEFLRQIKENPDQWHIGNICISDVTSVNKLRSYVNREEYQTVTGIVTCCLFLLISIFLGLLGTFWFRTGQRTVEIAIRMVNGATNRQIFTRLVTEGIILWSAALIFIGLLMFVVFKFDLLSEVIYSEMTKSIIYGTIISLVSLLIMIIAGIFFPALRASKIEPAIALKDE